MSSNELRRFKFIMEGKEIVYSAILSVSPVDMKTKIYSIFYTDEEGRYSCELYSVEDVLRSVETGEWKILESEEK